MPISLTPSRRKRIRRSDAAGIAWMVDREHYWTEEALREILKRVERLCHEDLAGAVSAGRSALTILETRILFPSADLTGLTMSIYGSTLRLAGELEKALRVYDQGLGTPGLTKGAQSDLYFRRSVTLVCLGLTEEGLQSIESALRLNPQCPTHLATRGWVRMLAGDFRGTMEDCLTVIRKGPQLPSRDLAYFAAIVNAAACLSFEAGVRVTHEQLALLENAVQDFRSALPDRGTSFYKYQRMRHMISRAEALILADKGMLDRSISILERVVVGLQDFPDDALDASVDLACLLAKDGREKEAAQEVRRILEISRTCSWRLSLSAKNVLRHAAQEASINVLQATELRIRLRSRERPRLSANTEAA